MRNLINLLTAVLLFVGLLPLSAQTLTRSTIGSRPTKNLIRPARPMGGPSRTSVASFPTRLSMKHASVTASNGRTVEFIGNVVGSTAYNWSDNSYFGLYRFGSVSPITFTNLLTNSYCFANGGGAVVGDYYYCVSWGYEKEGTDSHFRVRKMKYDIETGELVENQIVDDEYPLIGVCNVAKSPKDGKIYGIFMGEGLTADQYLASIDYETNTRTDIVKLQGGQFVAFAVDKDGKFYAIGTDANLYSIDPSTGAVTAIGSTGRNLYPYDTYGKSNWGYYLQSAVVDPTSGDFYWAASEGDGTAGLYTVNTTTGQTTLVGSFPKGEQLASLDIIGSDIADGAPGRVTSLVAKADKDDLNKLNVTFTLPTKSINGEALDAFSSIDYTINVNDETVSTGSGKPGEAIAYSKNVASGRYTVTVIPSNAAGNGPEATTHTYVGADVPLAVTNLLLSVDNNRKATLTWKAPSATGVNGSEVYADQLTYTVIRHTSERVDTVAKGISQTSFTETLADEGLKVYFYEVIADNHGVESATTQSNRVSLGTYVIPPYFEGFDDDYAFNNYYKLDNNNTLSTWAYNADGQNIVYTCSEAYNADNWVLTPEMQLTKGTKYTFSFKIKTTSYYNEHIEVGYGFSDKNVNAFKTIIPDTVVKTQGFETVTRDVTIDSTGIYRFGIHATSPHGQYKIYVDDISVEGSSLNAPSAVTGATLTADPTGKLSATIKFTAPTTNVNGKALISISKVEILSGNTKVLATVNDVQPGQEKSVTVSAHNGINTYQIYAYGADGQRGQKAEVSGYVGQDIPQFGSDAELNIYDNGDGTTKFAWTPVGTEGVNQGFVDPQTVTYVVHLLNEENKPGAVIDSITGATSLTSNNVSFDGEPSAKKFVVIAKDLAGQSDGLTGAISSGAVAQLPFHDSFRGGEFEQPGWWATYKGYAQFTADGNPSSDDDGGTALWNALSDGNTSTLVSRRINIKSATNPKLYFSYKINYYWGDMELSAGADNLKENGYKALMKATFADSTQQDGWYHAVCDLSDFAGSDNIVLKFKAKCNSFCTLYIDNVNVADVKTNDLAVTDFQVPDTFQVGKAGDIKIRVSNEGSTAASGYTVRLLNGDKEVAAQSGSELEPYFGYKDFDFTFTPTVNDVDGTLRTVVDFNGDENTENNDSTVRLTIKQNSVPAVDNLAGTKNGNTVNLTWTYPHALDFGPTNTESFEWYDSFTTGGVTSTQHEGNIGSWKVIDNDHFVNTYGLESPTSAYAYAHRYEAHAWQVFTPSYLFNLNSEDVANAVAPHTGGSYLISFDAPANDSIQHSDDWLISPKLDTLAQTIKFFVKSLPSEYGNETYEVLYSTTGTDIDDFTAIGGTRTAPMIWTEVDVDLPAGARYFAIRKTSGDVFAMMLDDITYRGEKTAETTLTVTGYNVYRDGELIGSTSADVTSYTDNITDGEVHKYNVTALYGDVESPLSNTVTTDIMLGINGISVSGDGHDLSVYTENGSLVARGANGLNGLRRGVYIVHDAVTGKTVKIIK